MRFFLVLRRSRFELALSNLWSSCVALRMANLPEKVLETARDVALHTREYVPVDVDGGLDRCVRVRPRSVRQPGLGARCWCAAGRASDGYHCGVVMLKVMRGRLKYGCRNELKFALCADLLDLGGGRPCGMARHPVTAADAHEGRNRKIAVQRVVGCTVWTTCNLQPYGRPEECFHGGFPSAALGHLYSLSIYGDRRCEENFAGVSPLTR